MPIVFVLLIASFAFNYVLPHYPAVSFYGVLVMNGYMLLAIADAVWCWVRLRRRLNEKFGAERVKNEGSIFFYIMSRCFMLRRWRAPPRWRSGAGTPPDPFQCVPDRNGVQRTTRAADPVARARLIRPGQAGPL